MVLSIVKNCLALILAASVLTACSKSDAQRDFERAAQSVPRNITEMTVNGQPVENGRTDPDDWRISPMYAGLVEIDTPAFPNPVNTGTPLRIFLKNDFIDTINGLDVYVFQNDFSDLRGPFFTMDQSEIYQGLITIQLDPAQFSFQGVGNSNIYRILIYDGREDLISYGDVEVIP